MMKQVVYEISENRSLTDDIFRMELRGDVSAIRRPGQFVDIKLDGFFLRRPISVCDWNGEGLTLIYKAEGQGTRAMSRMRPGDRLDVLSGLGNGYDMSKSPVAPLLIGGGVGVPPLVGLARRLQDLGKKPEVLLGFNRKEDVFCRREFAELGIADRKSVV